MLENLLQQRDEFQSKIREIDALSKSGVEKILQAIKNQRWFFFKNNKYILMDRDTALIWANLDYFPWRKDNNNIGWYSNPIMRIEVKNLIANINSRSWGGFNSWKIPQAHEFAQMIYDNTFPFQEGLKFYIKNERRWCIAFGNELLTTLSSEVYKSVLCRVFSLNENSEYMSPLDESTLCGTYVIPCCHSLVPPNFSATPREVLEIFTRHNLIPMFESYEADNLYRRIYVDKIISNRQRFLNQISELDRKIAEQKKIAEEEAKRKKLEEEQRRKLVGSNPKLTANFDYRSLIAKYDVAALEKSPIKYFDAVLNVTDALLNILQEYENAQANTIADCLKITLKLNAKYVDNPNLTPEENALLAERQKFLATRLELATDEPKRKILAVKAQANHFFTRLEAFNAGDKSIRDLAVLQAEPRVDFELLVENLARIVLDTQRRVDFFAENKNFVASVVNSQAHWSDDYKAFKTSLREELAATCRNESIDDEIFSAWYDDWQVKRFAIEQRFLPLVEFAIKGNLIDVFDVILGSLHTYRDAVDKFYLHERKNIYQKFAFQAGGDLQEKFETESELYKLAEKLQRDLQEIIFKRDKTEERIFLLRWAEPLLNLPLDEISNFIRDRELDAIAEEVLNQFAELRRQNFEQYLADSKSYGEATQKREKEFNALIFRMRKDLRKS